MTKGVKRCHTNVKRGLETAYRYLSAPIHPLLLCHGGVKRGVWPGLYPDAYDLL